MQYKLLLGQPVRNGEIYASSNIIGLFKGIEGLCISLININKITSNPKARTNEYSVF